MHPQHAGFHSRPVSFVEDAGPEMTVVPGPQDGVSFGIHPCSTQYYHSYAPGSTSMCMHPTQHSGGGHLFASQQPTSHYTSQFSSQVPTSHYAVPQPAISHHRGPGVYSSNIASIQATGSSSSLESQRPGASFCGNNNYMNGLSNDPFTQQTLHPSGTLVDPPTGFAIPGERSSHINVQKLPPPNPYVSVE